MARCAPDRGNPHDGPVTVRALTDLFARGAVAVLTGAGISTDSGIPDYRGATGAQRRSAPMTHQEFLRDPQARQRYWARSHVGWRTISDARPNASHLALAALERAGLVSGVVTQNVDGLHQAAGSQRVIDLHGRLDRVVCLECGDLTQRAEVDARLRSANVEWRSVVLAHQADGDADLPADAVASFVMVDCRLCGGPLKPDVVYFGDNVPRPRVQDAERLVDAARSLVVLGSSLHVFSGRRFVVRAGERGIPVAIVNLGPTRCDAAADVRLDEPLADVMGGVLGLLAPESARSGLATSG